MKTQRKKVVIKSEDLRLVYGEVYSPLVVDTDDDVMTAEEIRKMAHSFLAKGRTSKIDVGHSQQECGVVVVESFIARKNDPDDFIDGSWVVGALILPDELWEKVKKGDLNAFSFFGTAQRTEAEVSVEVVKRIVGKTEESKDGLLPPHVHGVVVVFDDNGKLVATETEKEIDHVHPVLKATATEKAIEHSHRLVLIDNKSKPEEA